MVFISFVEAIICGHGHNGYTFCSSSQLQPSSPEASLDPFRPKETLEGKVKDKPPEALVGAGGTCEVPDESPKPSLELSESSSKEEKGPCEGMERQTQTASPPGKGDVDDKEEGPVSE